MSNEPAIPKHSPLLLATGIFAMLWLMARAWVQSVTIDEADTYLHFVFQPYAAHWLPNANNHVLNSMLIRLLTSIFGASAFTLRLPALIGAALYIGAAYFLVRLITRRQLMQWAMFVCLVYSPFVMDYLVAARGYSLASAFLLWMIVLAARHQAQDEKGRAAGLRRTSVLISVAAALCISANLSFAIAGALLTLGIFLWISLYHRQESLRALLLFTVPGLAVAYFFVGPAVLNWSKAQFTWGSDSMLRTVRSLVHASLFEPNDYLLHAPLHHYLVHFGTFLYPLLAAFVLWRGVMLVAGRSTLVADTTPRLIGVAAVCGAAMLIALACHQLLFWTYGILLPLDRTAMWAMVLFLVMAGALAAVPMTSSAGRLSGTALSVILLLIACYNLACLRLTYFNEWKYDADMKNVYSVLKYYNQTFGITKVSTNWRYAAALNFYRAVSGIGTLEPIPIPPDVVNSYPPGFQAYVFYYPWDEEFYKREGLTLVYHDAVTEVAIGIRPEALQ